MNESDLKRGITERSGKVEKEGAIGLRTRSVLWYLTFFGFGINYILRINASITIVDMIDTSFRKSTGDRKIVTSECIAETNWTTRTELINEGTSVENTKYVSLERRLLDVLGVRHSIIEFNVEI